MKKFSLLLLALICSVTTWADWSNYNAWSNYAYFDYRPTEIPEGVSTARSNAGTVCDCACEGSLTVGKQGKLVFASDGDYTITFKYSSGNDRLDILGVDVLNDASEVVYSDYHHSYTGTYANLNEYTLSGVKAGTYTVRYWISCSSSLSSVGTITWSPAVTAAEVPFGKPAFGGTVWTWNTETSKFDADGQTSTATPSRDSTTGPVYTFSDAGTVKTSVNTSTDTSDKGGIRVMSSSASSTSNVTSNIGRWAGSIEVSTWSVANVNYSASLKGTEADGYATVWTDGDLTISGRANFDMNDGTNQRWYIGENGILRTSFTSVSRGSRLWDLDVVVTDEAAISGHERSKVTLTKQVMTWGANLSSDINSIRVWYKDADGKLTKLESSAVSYDATGITITYEGLGYKLITYTTNYKDGENTLKTESVTKYDYEDVPTVASRTWFGWTQGSETYDADTHTYTVPMTKKDIENKMYRIYAKNSGSDTKYYVKFNDYVSTGIPSVDTYNPTFTTTEKDGSIIEFTNNGLSSSLYGSKWYINKAKTTNYWASTNWKNCLSDTKSEWCIFANSDDAMHLYNYSGFAGLNNLNNNAKTIDPTSSNKDYYTIFTDKSVDKFSEDEPTGSNTTKCGLEFYLEEVTTIFYTVDYNIYYGTTKVGETQSNEVADGQPYPTPTLPAYASVKSGMPTGNVTADGSYDIQIEYTLPFEYAADVASISKWYTFKMHGNATYQRYLYNAGTDVKIAGAKEVPSDNRAYLWAFVGDPLNGFKVIAYGTEGKGITSATPGTVGTPSTFSVYKSTTMTGDAWFALYDATTSDHFLNWSWSSFDLQRWNAADTGSSIQVAEADPATLANMRLTSAEWGTFCAPFDVTIPDENIKAYTGEVSTKDWIKLTELENGTIPANTAVVVYYKGLKETKSYDFYDVPTDAAGEESCFTGNTGAVTAVAEGDYILQKNADLVGWYKVGTTAVTIGKNRCYLPASVVPNAARASYMMSFGDETTGINNIATEAATKADGKYLVNGKIVVVKAGKAYNANGTLVK